MMAYVQYNADPTYGFYILQDVCALSRRAEMITYSYTYVYNNVVEILYVLHDRKDVGLGLHMLFSCRMPSSLLFLSIIYTCFPL